MLLGLQLCTATAVHVCQQRQVFKILVFPAYSDCMCLSAAVLLETACVRMTTLFTDCMSCVQQLGVHRSSSVASSGLSNANRANSDSSDKLNDAALALKEMQGSSASYTERSRINRARSAGIVPEFATVQEESAGENSDADVCRSLNADSIDPSSYSSQDLAGTVEAGTMLPDRKVAELKQSVRSDRSIVSKGGGRTTAHVGFAN